MEMRLKALPWLTRLSGFVMLVTLLLVNISPARKYYAKSNEFEGVNADEIAGEEYNFVPPNILVELTNDADEDYIYTDREYANAPGQEVYFLVKIINNVGEAAVIEAIVDDTFSDMGTCVNLVGTTLAGFSSMQCKYRGELPFGVVDLNNTVIVRVANNAGEISSASDSTRSIYGVEETATTVPSPTKTATAVPSKTALPTATKTEEKIKPTATTLNTATAVFSPTIESRAENTPTAFITHQPQGGQPTAAPMDGSTAGRVAAILTETAQAEGAQGEIMAEDGEIEASQILLACLGAIVLLLIAGVVFELLRWRNARQGN